MNNTQLPERIYRKEPLPDIKEIREFIESSDAVDAFDSLLDFLDNNYNFEREICFGGQNYGVLIRYRRNGKTLVSIFPEKNSISIVLIYGKKEVITFNAWRAQFGPYMTEIFDSTPQLHDGRWLLIKLKDKSLLPELEKMIMVKKTIKKS